MDMKASPQPQLTVGIFPVAMASLRLFGFVALVVVMLPAMMVLRMAGSPQAEAMPRRFHAILTRLVGFRLRVHGLDKKVEESAGAPVLYVANHSSYLDIPVLGALIPARFVAKAEVERWPFIGFLARVQKTVFVERRAIRAAHQRDGLRDVLEKGESLIVFPEGTSSDGMRTLPFKSSLFSIVEKPLSSGVLAVVQPVTVLCTELGGMPMGRPWRPYYAWYGDMTLVRHVWDVFKIGDFTIDVIFHAPVTMRDFGDRKLLSDYCERMIACGVDRCVTGRLAG